MSVIRAFIAIDISTEIQTKLGEVSAELQRRLSDVPIRWVPVEKIHLTLKFLGDVSIANIEMLERIIQTEVSNRPVFENSVGEQGAYPTNRRPRVLWVAVQAPPELNSIQQGIDIETARLGYAREKRSFSPHLTIGRVSRGANSAEIRTISDVLCSFTVGFLGASRVRSVHLVKSDLKPGGAVYTKLYTANLVPVGS
jgi:2'-5' RNA ligase